MRRDVETKKRANKRGKASLNVPEEDDIGRGVVPHESATAPGSVSRPVGMRRKKGLKNVDPW